MKGKLTVGLALLVVACVSGWRMFHIKEVAPTQITGLSPGINRSRSAPATNWVTRPSQNISYRHFYSPLSDTPPVPTSDQLETWSESLNAITLKGMTPDFSGPPLATTFNETAARAEKGDTKAAMTLFKGLLYCMVTTMKSERDVENKIRLMTDAHTDADGHQSDDLDAAIAEVHRRYSYCSGLTEAQGKSVSHWGWLAARSGNPVAQAWAVAYAPPPSAYDPETIQKYRAQLRKMVNEAADAGVPEAWVELYQGYLIGAYGYPRDPVKAYASLYAEYMLTNSPYLAHEIWKQSQNLSVVQLQEGEQLAQKYYRKIKRQH